MDNKFIGIMTYTNTPNLIFTFILWIPSGNSQILIPFIDFSTYFLIIRTLIFDQIMFSLRNFIFSQVNIGSNRSPIIVIHFVKCNSNLLNFHPCKLIDPNNSITSLMISFNHYILSSFYKFHFSYYKNISYLDVNHII